MSDSSSRTKSRRAKVLSRPYLVAWALVIGLPLAGYGVAYWLGAQRAAVRRCLTQPVREFRGHEFRVRSVAFSADGRRCASTEDLYDDAVLIWDVETRRCLRTFPRHENSITYTVALDSDGRRCLAGSIYDPPPFLIPGYWPKRFDCLLWDVETGELLQTLKGQSEEI